MESKLIADLNTIFKNQIDQELLNKLVSYLDSISPAYPNIFRLNTRNRNNKILHYFSLVNISKESPVVFAGARVRNLEYTMVPAIRFLRENISLRDVPARFQFPYKKNPKWKCVEIHKETIKLFHNLINTQIRNYLQ